jgi:hypothetical protein
MLQQEHLEKMLDTKSRTMEITLAAYLAAAWRGGCQGHVVVVIWLRDQLRRECSTLCYCAMTLLESPTLGKCEKTI